MLESFQELFEDTEEYIVVIDDVKNNKKNQQYTYPMSKAKAEKRAKNLQYDMDTSIPQYQFAKNIRVVKYSDFKKD